MRASEQKSETTAFGQENRHILHCRFSFQINISVKFRVRLLRNLCGNLIEKFVSDQSVEWIKSDILAMDEVEKMDDISGSLVKQVIFPPMQCASLGHEGLVYN